MSRNVPCRNKGKTPLQHLKTAHKHRQLEDIQLPLQQHTLPLRIVEPVAGLDTLGDELHAPVDGGGQAVPLQQAADDHAGEGVAGTGIDVYKRQELRSRTERT